jgi:hypothetical protein
MIDKNSKYRGTVARFMNSALGPNSWQHEVNGICPRRGTDRIHTDFSLTTRAYR